MKSIKFAKNLTAFWAFYFVIGNFYFGRNATPQSESETWFDLISRILIIVIFVEYFTPMLLMLERKVEHNEKDNALQRTNDCLSESMKLTDEAHKMINEYSVLVDKLNLKIESLQNELKKYQQ